MLSSPIPAQQQTAYSAQPWKDHVAYDAARSGTEKRGRVTAFLRLVVAAAGLVAIAVAVAGVIAFRVRGIVVATV